MKSKINLGSWVSTQLGAREFYTLPRALARLGALDSLWTDVWFPYANKRGFSGRVGTLSQRYAPGISSELVHSRTFREVARGVFGKQSGPAGWLRSGDRFGKWLERSLDSRVSSNRLVGAFGYTGGSQELLSWARSRGIKAVLGQVDPGPAWYRTVEEERVRWPGAEPPPAAHLAEYLTKIQTEWALADAIVVNSRHAQDSLINEGVPAAKLHILPLCADVDSELGALPKQLGRSSRFTCLFVGNLSLAKGFQYFAEAARLAGERYEFRAAGGIALLPEFVLSRTDWPVTYLGHLNRLSLQEEYDRADVVIFPTLSDGFGLVQVEAQARGLPVIATRHCGDVVNDGVDGFVIDARDAGGIVDRLQALRDSPSLYRQMSAAAIENSRAFDFSTYVERVEATFLDILARPRL